MFGAGCRLFDVPLATSFAHHPFPLSMPYIGEPQLTQPMKNGSSGITWGIFIG